jgi:hypothetical protein
MCRFGRGVLGNQSVNLKDGWFKEQRVQFRVDAEQTVRFEAEMVKNEHGRQTISTYSLCLFLVLSCWGGNNNYLRR